MSRQETKKIPWKFIQEIGLSGVYFGIAISATYAGLWIFIYSALALAKAHQGTIKDHRIELGIMFLATAPTAIFGQGVLAILRPIQQKINELEESDRSE